MIGFFAFREYKKVLQKRAFCIEMKISMTAISKRQFARFIHTKNQNKLRKVFVQKLETLQKARQFLLHFYIQKAGHFTLFMKI